MAADGVSTTAAWSIFYHFFLNQTEHDILGVHCQTLVQCSIDFDTWKASKYGGYIRFCTEHSFLQVRRHWILYLGFDNLSEGEKQTIRASFTCGMKVTQNIYKGNKVITSLRSAGPLFGSSIDEAGKSHDAFWTTGTTRLNSRSAAQLPHTNPTFVYSLSGNKFNVHYGTDPLTAFHLAPAFVTIKDGQRLLPKVPTLQDVVKTAVAQFDLWCSSFKKRVSPSSMAPANLVIRFHAGEAMAFARALHVFQRSKSVQSGVYTSPWGGAQIILDDNDYSKGSPSAPVVFNVIDTSNLTDHLGLLNILTTTVPLLQGKPWAAIHTNTLVQISQASKLSLRALGDIPTLSLLLGVSPNACRSHFTTQSNKHEILASPSSEPYSQLHEHTSWKLVPTVVSGYVDDDVAAFVKRSGCATWDTKGLARFFFAMYLKMFDDENISSALQNMTLAGLTSRSLCCYTRESLVALFALVKERLEVDWTDVIDTFSDLLAVDRTLLMGLNNYQDFICHLYLRNIYVMKSMKPDWLERLRDAHTNGLFQGWQDIPPAVCVVLKVPRRRLKVLEDMDADEILTPFLQCETRGTQFHNIHASIRPIFGDTVLSSVEGEPVIVINEDLRGWHGGSDLIVTFYMPSWILLQHGLGAVEVGLFVKSTPQTMDTLLPKLGMHLGIYTTKASNSANVQLVRNRPNNLEERRHLQTQLFLASPISKAQKKVEVDFHASAAKVSTLTVRTDISDLMAKTSLSQGASVVTQAIADNVIRVNIQDYKTIIVYPFPILNNQTKVRIARKSSYVEVRDHINLLTLSNNLLDRSTRQNRL